MYAIRGGEYSNKAEEKLCIFILFIAGISYRRYQQIWYLEEKKNFPYLFICCTIFVFYEVIMPSQFRAHSHTEMCLCGIMLVCLSGAPGIYLCQWSRSSWHPRLTSGMFPELLWQADLWKVHLSPQGSFCFAVLNISLYCSFYWTCWVCMKFGHFNAADAKALKPSNSCIVFEIYVLYLLM